jgi:hypothetical protein
MSRQNKNRKENRQMAANNSQQLTEQPKGYITLPDTKAAKTDPEAIWEKPSYDPNSSDDDESLRVIRDGTIEP